MSLCTSVTIAAVAVFVYAWLVPLCVWGFLTWRKGTEPQISSYSFLETVCVYGYSLFIYVPTSVSSGSLLSWTVVFCSSLKHSDLFSYLHPSGVVDDSLELASVAVDCGCHGDLWLLAGHHILAHSP